MANYSCEDADLNHLSFAMLRKCGYLYRCYYNTENCAESEIISNLYGYDAT